MLHNRVICTEEFDPTLKKTGLNIKSAISAALNALGLAMDEDLCTRGSNVIVALKDTERIDCIAHFLNTILRNSFDEKKNCPASINSPTSLC